MNLMDIELLTAPNSEPSSQLWVYLTVLSVVLIVIVVGVFIGRRARSMRSELHRLQRRLAQGEALQSIALALFKLAQPRLSLNAEQRTQLNQACFSPQGVSRETFDSLLNQLIQQAQEHKL